MPSLVRSAALHGIDAIPLEIEVDVLQGLPSFTVVGLGDKTIQEAKERLISALSHLKYTPPRRKTIVSLAPASLRKEGSLYDVPIALGFLLASGQINFDASKLKDTWFIGELGLNGAIRPVSGVLPIVLAAAKKKLNRLYIPAGNSSEAAAVADQLTIFPVSNLTDLLRHLMGGDTLTPLTRPPFVSEFSPPALDFSHIKGQYHAKRALLIAAASGHNVLMVGPPGSGKTLLARALAGILPPLSQEESYVVTSLYSVAGYLTEGQGLMVTRPFRAPHHGASSVALVGGGTNPKPGEVSLAHLGVLFLDELPEFPRQVLDQLRQPIEDGLITVSRASSTVRYPARMMLVGAMNPCKCGYLGHGHKTCQCSPGDVLRYQRRISGPLLDRFDLHLGVPDVPVSELLAEEEPPGQTVISSLSLSGQAVAARSAQMDRQGKLNSALTVSEIKVHCHISDLTKRLLYQAEERFHLSARAIHRLLKVSRTIADLDRKPRIDSSHLAEALQYREQLKATLPDFV